MITTLKWYKIMKLLAPTSQCLRVNVMPLLHDTHSNQIKVHRIASTVVFRDSVARESPSGFWNQLAATTEETEGPRKNSHQVIATHPSMEVSLSCLLQYVSDLGTVSSLWKINHWLSIFKDTPGVAISIDAQWESCIVCVYKIKAESPFLDFKWQVDI